MKTEGCAKAGDALDALAILILIGIESMPSLIQICCIRIYIYMYNVYIYIYTHTFYIYIYLYICVIYTSPAHVTTSIQDINPGFDIIDSNPPCRPPIDTQNPMDNR